jgi:hypothetical protein
VVAFYGTGIGNWVYVTLKIVQEALKWKDENTEYTETKASNNKRGFYSIPGQKHGRKIRKHVLNAAIVWHILPVWTAA